MRRNDDRKGHRRVRFVLPLVVFTMGAMLTAGAGAQTEAGQANRPETKPQLTYETLTIHHATNLDQEREILTVFRNMLQRARIDMVASENAIAIEGSAEDLETARKILEAMDKPTKTWRLTYTVADADGGSAGSHRYAMTVATGGEADIKQGDRVPIMTGTATGSGAEANQVQYVDVGMAIHARVDGGGDTLRLRTKVEDTGIAEGKSGMGGQDPVIRGTMLDSEVTLTAGKPVVLGSLEAPGSGKRQEISVTAEAVE